MKLYIDSREKDRVDYAIRKCKSWKWEYEVKQLPIGDYVCGNTVIEFKSAMDFIASVYDGRLRRETVNQANSFPYHFVFIVGSVGASCHWYKKITNRQFHTTQFYKAVASLLTYTNVVLLPNQKEAFHLMRYVMEKCNATGNRTVVPVEKLSRNPCYNFLASIPRISSKRAETICSELNLRTARDLFKIRKKDLMSVKGIGETLADEIILNLQGEKIEK